MQVLQLPLLDSLPVSAKKRLGMAIGNQNILHLSLPLSNHP
jgi:hypothetical protein